MPTLAQTSLRSGPGQIILNYSSDLNMLFITQSGEVDSVSLTQSVFQIVDQVSPAF